jgi:hypothetical protein
MLDGMGHALLGDGHGLHGYVDRKGKMKRVNFRHIDFPDSA